LIVLPETELDELKNYFENRNYKSSYAPGFTWRGITYGELTVFNANILTLKSANIIALGGTGERNLVFIRESLKFDVRVAKITIDKTALATSFQYRDQQFTLVNTHLCSDVHNRRKLTQLQVVLHAVGKDKPTIILGDFNYPMGSGLEKLMRGNGFVSALDRQNTFRFGPGVYWQNDYIFRRNCVVEETEVKKIHHSDHYPVFFKVAL